MLKRSRLKTDHLTPEVPVTFPLEPHSATAPGVGGGGGGMEMSPKSRGEAASSHVRQVVRPPVALDADVGGDMKPLYGLPQFFDQVEYLCPQVHVCHCP